MASCWKAAASARTWLSKRRLNSCRNATRYSKQRCRCSARRSLGRTGACPSGLQGAGGSQSQIGIDDRIVVAGDDAIAVGITAQHAFADRRPSAKVRVHQRVIVGVDLAVEVEIAEVRVLPDNGGGVDGVA